MPFGGLVEMVGLGGTLSSRPIEQRKAVATIGLRNLIVEMNVRCTAAMLLNKDPKVVEFGMRKMLEAVNPEDQ